MRSPAPIDAISLGPWQAWPNAGTENVDPYSRARLARTGEIPVTFKNNTGSPVRVVVRIESDKLEFPAGFVQELELDRKSVV